MKLTWLASCALAIAACGGDTDPPEATPGTAATTSPTSTPTTPSSAPAGSTVMVAPTTAAATIATTASENTAVESSAVAGTVVEMFAGSAWFLGEVPATAIAADAELEPIRLGMINQEDTPLGSYPEVRAAAEAAVAWINGELGGVGGRPVELLTCVTSFDPDQSRACALELLEAGVVAFVGGVDVTSEGSIAEIETAGRAVFGGVPATLAEQRSDRVFAFSGGDVGALAAFLFHASEAGASTALIAYGEGVPSFEVAARDYGQAVGEMLGLTVELVPYPILTEDANVVFGPAEAADADAVLVLAATSSCVPFMRAASESGRQLYLTGACADVQQITAAGDAASAVLFNAEGPFDSALADAAIFQAVTERYAAEPAFGAGTVSFRGVMNLYALMLEAGPDPTTEVLVDLARSSQMRPSFWGHPYTCDGKQVPGLPALCAPQQLIFGIDRDGAAVAVTDWIATDELFAAIDPDRSPAADRSEAPDDAADTGG
jgi:branched-chain amino acid transport system substrate-binding protein